MDRFWKKVDTSGDCWEWTAAKDPAGYGRFAINGENGRAHRISWELSVGPIPTKMCICHACDNPGCVNPDHLFLGTYSDNMKDMWGKGRHTVVVQAGRKNNNAKLADEDVRLIRKMRGPQREIAKQFGISQATVSLIKTGKAWRHL